MVVNDSPGRLDHCTSTGRRRRQGVRSSCSFVRRVSGPHNSYVVRPVLLGAMPSADCRRTDGRFITQGNLVPVHVA